MILDIPRSRINILLNLKKDYKIYLLSNTNSIHQKKFLTEIYNENNISFNELFEKAYFSHEIGLRKPNKEVFEFVFNDCNLNPTETLFMQNGLAKGATVQNGLDMLHIQAEESWAIWNAKM